jgi:Flp pilus assembly protein CpaB
LLLALLAAGLVYILGSFSGGGSIGGGPTQTVVVAKQAIPLRHTITKDDLTTLKSVSTNVPNTYTNENDLVGLIAEIQISSGSVITKDMLAKDINLVPAGSAPAFLPLAKGYVALTIPTSEQTGVAGHITLFDYFNVIASGSLCQFPKACKASTSAAGNTTVSKTVFFDVRVIGLGPATPNVQSANGGTVVGGTQGVSGGLTSSLTVELTQCDAEYFTWFLNNMQLKYSLESVADYLTAPTAPDPTCPDVLAAHGVAVTQVEARYHFASLGS